MSQVKVEWAVKLAVRGVWMGTYPLLRVHAIVSACTALAGKGPFPACSIAPVPELEGGLGNLPPCCLATQRKYS